MMKVIHERRKRPELGADSGRKSHQSYLYDTKKTPVRVIFTHFLADANKRGLGELL